MKLLLFPRGVNTEPCFIILAGTPLFRLPVCTLSSRMDADMGKGFDSELQAPGVLLTSDCMSSFGGGGKEAKGPCPPIFSCFFRLAYYYLNTIDNPFGSTVIRTAM